MGGQENKTKVVLQNLNPVWDSNMQFIVRDLEQDLLCITVYDKDLFTPDGKTFYCNLLSSHSSVIFYCSAGMVKFAVEHPRVLNTGTKCVVFSPSDCLSVGQFLCLIQSCKVAKLLKKKPCALAEDEDSSTLDTHPLLEICWDGEENGGQYW